MRAFIVVLLSLFCVFTTDAAADFGRYSAIGNQQDSRWNVRGFQYPRLNFEISDSECAADSKEQNPDVQWKVEATVAAIILLGVFWLVALIQGLRHKWVIFHSGTDIFICSIWLPCLLIAYLMHTEASTIVFKTVAATFLLAAGVCLPYSLYGAYKDNVSIFRSIPVALFKLSFVWLGVGLSLVPAANSEGWKGKKQTQWWDIFCLGIFGYLAYRLMNKDEVWAERGWN